MSQTKVIYNQGEVQGKVFSIFIDYDDKWKTNRGTVTVERTRSWENASGQQQATDYIPVGFFGKPADWVKEKGIRKGDMVHITYRLGGRAMKDKVDSYFPTVNGFKCELLNEVSPQSLPPNETPTQGAKTDDDIPF